MARCSTKLPTLTHLFHDILTRLYVQETNIFDKGSFMWFKQKKTQFPFLHLFKNFKLIGMVLKRGTSFRQHLAPYYKCLETNV
jgi:hypothetical protein